MVEVNATLLQVGFHIIINRVILGSGKSQLNKNLAREYLKPAVVTHGGDNALLLNN